MQFEHLPPEILGLVLYFLPQTDLYQCTLVDKRFRSHATPSLWRAPEFKENERVTLFTQCLSCNSSTTAKHGHHVRHLAMDSMLSDDELLAMLPHLPQLEVLELTHAQLLSDTSVIHVSRYCPGLQQLLLHGAAITYRSAHYLGRCQRLKSLTLRDCEHLSPLTLLPFADCPLEYLDLTGNAWVNATDTARDLRAFDSLKHLDLICCNNAFMRMNDFLERLLWDADAGQVVLPRLTCFAIDGRKQQPTDPAVYRFIELHPHLTELTLMACEITDISIHAMAHHLRDLVFLDISFCEEITAPCIRHLIYRCRHLQMIGLKGCNVSKPDFPELIHPTNPRERFDPNAVIRLPLQDLMLDRLEQVDIDTVRLRRGEQPWEDMPLTAELDIVEEVADHNGMAIDDPLPDGYAAIQYSIQNDII